MGLSRIFEECRTNFNLLCIGFDSSLLFFYFGLLILFFQQIWFQDHLILGYHSDHEGMQFFINIGIHESCELEALLPPRDSIGDEFRWLRTIFNSSCPDRPNAFRFVRLGRM